MTRKSFAIGAAAALAVSGLVSTPASAAETLTLTPSAGSGYTTVANSTFTLNAGIPSGIVAESYKYLKYRVVNASMTAYTLDMTLSGDLSGDTQANNYGGADSSFADGAGATDTAGVNDTDFVVQPSANNAAPAGAQGKVNGLTIVQDSAAAGSSVVVTAWLDINDNNAIDAGEDTSPARTVTFVKSSAVTATVSLVAPQASDATLKARVAFAFPSDLNARQIDPTDMLVQFGTYSSSTFTVIESYADAANGTGNVTNATTVTSKTIASSNNQGNDVIWNSTDGVFEAVFTPNDVSGTAGASALAVTAGTTYAARLFLDNDDDGTASVSDTREGSISTSKVAAAATGYSAKVNVVGTKDAKTSTIGYEDNGTDNYLVSAVAIADNTAAAAEVRATATASSGYDLVVFVGTDAAAPVQVKDVPVTVVVTADASTTLADAVTVEGKTVFSGQTRSFTKTTGTDGTIKISVAAAKADADDQLDFRIVMNGIEFGGSTASDATVSWDAADYSIYAVDDLASSGAVSITSGATYSITYQMVDQWGTAPANSAYRVVANDKASTNAERTTAADFAVNSTFVDGKSTVTITDNGVGTGSYTMTAAFATLDGSTDTSTAGKFVDTVVAVVVDTTASSITLTKLAYGTAQANDANGDGDYADVGDTDNTKKLIVETKDLVGYIPNLATPTESAPTLTANQYVTVGGTVKNAAGAAVAYAPVTLQASGFLFKSGSNYVLDEITLRADADGEFSVDVYSRVGNAQTIRMTSGAATASQALTYAAAVSGAAESFTLTTPGASEPGKTVDVSVKVVDKFGNAVQGASVTLSSTGPGYLLNTSGTTLKNGTFSTKLLLGVNDSGDAVIVATMTIDGDEVGKTSTIKVGVGAVAASDQKVNAGSFKGYVALYAKGYAGQRMSAKVGKDWVVVPVLASSFERVVEFTGAGYTISVPIYIDRVLVDTITVTTK